LQAGKEEAMKRICVMAGVLSTVACAITAQAAAIEDCPLPPGTIKVELPSGLPPALGKAMGNNIALPGEPFDATDVVVKGHKYSRYIFVWNRGKRWIVATEQGGIALRAMVYVYELRKEGTTAALIEKRITFPEGVCVDATRLAEH
jgi:hypothetical protein